MNPSSSDIHPGNNTQQGRGSAKIALVALGIVFGQAVLYGPALLGTKILLPLGCLAEGTKYIPHPPGAPEIVSPQPILLDQVTLTEPERRFAAKELSAGRFPRWTPHEFGGVPFIWPKYSPFYLLSALSESPNLIPWSDLLLALVSGFGAFAFCRRVLNLSYWPSALAAWCYPLTGWFILFQGYTTGTPVAWLPWIFCAIDRTVRGRPAAVVGLAVVTAMVLVSGHLDVAGQVLLISGLFALWCFWDVHRARCVRFFLRRGALALVLGYGFGFLLAAPYTLPIQEYVQTSARFARRGAGVEERPPVGIIALPQIVLPDMYGTYAEQGTCPLLDAKEINQIESPAESYTGLLATLLLAPWALLDRRRRSASVFFLLLGALGYSWALNVPGVVHLLRLPGLNLMSHNRLVFATSFSILALATIGFEALVEARLFQRRLWWLQVALLSGFLGWSLYRAAVLPEPLATKFESMIRAGQPDMWVPNLGDLRDAQAWFIERYRRAAILCVAGIAIWVALRYRPAAHRLLIPVVAVMMLGDLLLFGYGKRVLQEKDLYFPAIPALAEMANSDPGRAIGIDTLPANLLQAIGLTDIRGYDSVDPERWLKLVFASAKEGDHSDYAATQNFVPRYKIVRPDGVRFPSLLDMISLRYAIFRGLPAADVRPRFQSPDYYVLENHRALPRVYVPQRVESVRTDKDALRMVTIPEFDARNVAYVESRVDMWGPIRGTAKILEEIPTKIIVDAQMRTPGLLVLADNWDKGWRAYVNGKRTPILRTNYAIRGVLLSSGSNRVEFRYESSALTLGNGLALASILILLGWIRVAVWRRPKNNPICTRQVGPESESLPILQA